MLDDVLGVANVIQVDACESVTEIGARQEASCQRNIPVAELAMVFTNERQGKEIATTLWRFLEAQPILLNLWVDLFQRGGTCVE
ncbi:hypothetical protein D3C85_1215320 [compost metagenome]